MVHEGPFRSVPAQFGPTCPRCLGVALGRRSLDYVAVDECPRCGGVFVAPAALEAIVEDLALYQEVRTAYPEGPVVPPSGPMYVRCPRCGDVMNRRQFADGAKVIVDVCRMHGTWFDARELPAVVAFVERGGAETLAAEHRREIEQRFLEARAAAPAEEQPTTLLGNILKILKLKL